MGEKIGAEEVIRRQLYADIYTSTASLLKACQAGRIPHIHLNKKKTIFDVDDIKKDIERRKVEARRRI